MSHSRMGKAFRLKYSPDIYQGVILGSSRSYRAIREDHVGWEDRNVYNLSLPGVSFFEVLRYFSLALATQKIDRVVLGLDFFMFNGLRERRTDFNEGILFEDEGITPVNRYWGEVMPILFSRDTLRASFATFRKQRFVYPEGIDATRVAMVERRGLRETFWSVEKQYIYSEWFGNAEKKFGLEEPSGKSTLKYFSEFLKKAREHDVQVFVFISPAHARLWNALHKLGLSPLFEEWKKDLVRILEEEDAARGQFQLWDFSGYNTVTMEEVPGLGDVKGRMKWYWEASHYKRNVGDMILTRMFDSAKKQSDIPKDFGFSLRSDNIENYLERIRKKGWQWEQTHPEDSSELQREVEKFQSIYGKGKKVFSVNMAKKNAESNLPL